MPNEQYTTTRTIIISGRQSLWLDTGIVYPPGSTLTMTATGRVSYLGGTPDDGSSIYGIEAGGYYNIVDGQGAVVGRDRAFVYENYPSNGKSAGLAIAVRANGTTPESSLTDGLQYGDGTTIFTLTQGGRLWLQVNDRINFSDNTGSYTVTVNLPPPPAPTLTATPLPSSLVFGTNTTTSAIRLTVL